MDSKAVSREIKQRIWASLKTIGFDTFTSRTAWRHGADTIDVFNLQSFSKYDADVLGITTFSFRVNLGRYLAYIPPQWPPKIKAGKQVPEEHQCHFRGRLLPSLAILGSNDTVWAIDEAGRNLPWCIQDIVNQLPKAMEWYASMNNPADVLRILLYEKGDTPERHGFGRNPSPIRSYAAGYVALALGDRVTATRLLQEAVDSKRFVHLFSSVEGAMYRAL